MTEGERRISLNLHYGMPEQPLTNCIPVTPAEIDSHPDGFTIQELAAAAIKSISKEFTESLKIVGQTLSDFEATELPKCLIVYGPDEGDYYIDLSRIGMREYSHE
jgi:DNA topoisomerase VI subunit B